MSDIITTYILINGFCFFVFLFYGKILAKKGTFKEYYLASIFPILTYALTYGLRFGRDIDWNLYYFRYKALGESLHNEDYEFLFSMLCHLFYNIGIPYYMFIFLQCAFLMFTILVFLRNFRQYLPFILPLLLPLISTNDCYIRWWFAFSFFILSLNSYLHKNNAWALLWFLCAFFIHFGIIVLAPIIVFAPFINRRTIPPIIAIVLMFATSFILSLSSFTFLTYLSSQFLGLGLVGSGEKADIYLNSTQDLINGDLGRLGLYERSIMNKIRPLIAFIPTVYFMRNYIDKIKYGIFFYNLFVIGAILRPICLVEILDRYASSFAFFSCVVCGVYFYQAYKNRNTQSLLYFIIAMLGLFVSVWPTLSLLWKTENVFDMMFIWDAGGRNYLPIR